MAIVARTHGNSRNSGSPMTIDTASDSVNFLVAYNADVLVDYSSPIDNQSNVWVQCTGQNDTVAYGTLWYVENPTTNGSHEIYPENNGFNAQCMCALALSGVATSSSLDKQNGNNASNPFPSTSKQPGSVSPDDDNEVIIQGLSYRFDTGGPVTIDSPYTLVENNNAGNQNTALGYLVQTSKGATNPNWNFAINDTGYGCMAVATFKSAGGGGGGGGAFITPQPYGFW